MQSLSGLLFKRLVYRDMQASYSEVILTGKIQKHQICVKFLFLSFFFKETILSGLKQSI